MKYIIIISSIFLWANLLIGCYEDKGNYDFKEIFEVTIDSIEESYSGITLIDTLKINPVVTPSDVEYDYWWGIIKPGQGATLDTICHTRQLNYHLALEANDYTLVFMATEKKTGISRIVRSALRTTTPLSKGWYVLHSQGGVTDLDLFTKDGKAENIIAVNNGKGLRGEARNLNFSRYYYLWNETYEFYMQGNTLFAFASEDCASIRLSDGAIVYTFDELFYERPVVSDPQDMWFTYSEGYMINDGKMYTIYNLSENSGRFGGMVAGDYRLASHHVNAGSNPLLYDEKNSSFITISAMDNRVTTFKDTGAQPVNHMDADLLFMGPRGDYAWALMKKKSENVYMMLNLLAYYSYNYDYSNPTVRRDTLDLDLDIIHADKWATNTRNNIIYFALGNTVHSCNIDAGYQERLQENVKLSAQESVTYMRHLNFSSSAESFEYLAIGTYDGSDYKLYLHKIQAGNLQADPEVLKGKGKIGGVIYVDGSSCTAIN